jgi:hypothetical protein
VPRVSNFAETIVPEFSSTDFRMHFRIDRATFEIILQTIAPHLTVSVRFGFYVRMRIFAKSFHEHINE